MPKIIISKVVAYMLPFVQQKLHTLEKLVGISKPYCSSKMMSYTAVQFAFGFYTTSRSRMPNQDPEQIVALATRVNTKNKSKAEKKPQWFTDWNHSIYTPICKKRDTKECSN